MVIVITGASSGIGEALCLHYAMRGNTICLLAQNLTALENVAERCRAQGATAFVYGADVKDAPAMQRASEAIIHEAGVPDIVIANAGIRIEDPASYVGSNAAYEIMMVNYIGVINTFATFIEPMKKNGKGHLCAISSIAAYRATPNSGIYSASKAAVNLWTEALRLKLVPHHIHVTTAASGFVRTAMTADLSFHMPGILSAAQAAAIISKAIADKKSRIMFPWQSRFIWSMFCAMPGWLYDGVILCAKKYWPSRND
ncbi:MAG: SDR family NAD(P)-dependent oxidoreductase [Alphaproteobacteria bacterium]|nr:SDR family NAD(P)-dependent oxidoreductase [Alphaproteobacteria bacterium]